VARRSVAELVVATLVAAGAQRIYGVTGDSLNGIADAVRRRNDIRWIHTRHEETAAFGAGAEAQLTGKLSVCAGSCGPGNLHLINGLYDAHRSRAPVLALAAHIPSGEIGSTYFQETHPAQLFRECSLYCELVSHPSQMPRVLDIAVQSAVTGRGVSVVVIPGDIALKEATGTAGRLRFSTQPPTVRPSDEDLAKMAEILNASDRITILAGAGCAGAHGELLSLAGALKAPIVHAMRGKEFVEFDNPYDVGMTGLLGFSSGYNAMLNCDTLLMLGTDFPYQQFYPEEAKVIQVDIRGEQIGRRTKVDLAIIGDTKTTIAGLLPRLTPKTRDEHLTGALDDYRKARQGLDELATDCPGPEGTAHPQFVTRIVEELAAADAVITCDVGTPTIWAARYIRMNGKRRLLGSFSHGSMAGALPQAIGAQLAYPNRQVISLSGDGGVAMLLGDLLSLQQLRLPVKVVVFNNRSLGFVQMEMQAAGILDFATDLVNPDFARLAEAAGIRGIRAERPEQVRPALEEALAYDGPALVDAYVDRQTLALPPHLKLSEATGFGLFMMKAVLSGRGDEVIDLARTNWFRR
jgi:pyruvate dehydrogenase (quinone)